MREKKLAYIAFMLRLWEEDDNEQSHNRVGSTIWRASLENVSTRELHGFESMDDLVNFLERQKSLASHEHDADPE